MPDRDKLKKAREFASNFIFQNQIQPDQSAPPTYSQLIKSDVKRMGLSTGATGYLYIVKSLAVIVAILSLFSLGIVACCILLNLHKPTDVVSTFLTSTYYSVIHAFYTDELNWVYYFLIHGLQLIFTLILFISINMLKRQTQQMRVGVDSRTLSTGDFSIMVKNLPPDLKDAKQVSRHFEQWGRVHSVLLCFDVRDYGKLQLKLDDSVRKYIYSRLRHHATPELLKLYFQAYLCSEDRIVDTSLFNHHHHSGFGYLLRRLNYRQDIDSHTLNISRYLKERSNLASPSKRRSPGIAFVTFEYAMDAVNCAKDYQFNLNRLCCSGDTDDALIFSGTTIDVAPKIEPDDVIFHNIGYSYKNRLCRQSVLILVALVFVSFSVLLTLFVKSFTLSSIVSLILSLAISLLSSFLSFLIRSLSPFTRPLTKTESVSRSIFRIWLADFLFQILAHYIISIFRPKTNPDPATSIYPSTPYFFSPAWFDSTAFSLFLNAVVDYALILFFETSHIFDRLFRLPLSLSSKKLSQTELNFVRVPPAWPLERRFSNVIKTTMTLSLLAPFFPLVTPICALFLFLMFWVDKTNVIRYYHNPPQYGFGMINQGLSHISFAFHVNSISSIVTSFFSMWINDMQKTSPLHLIPFIAHSSLYAIIILISIIKWIYTKVQDGCGGEHDNAKEDGEDETQGLPFDIFEETVQTFQELHPLYMDEKRRLNTASGGEVGGEMMVEDYVNDVENSSASNSPNPMESGDEEEIVCLTRLLENLTPVEDEENASGKKQRVPHLVDTSPLSSYQYYSLYTLNAPLPRPFRIKDAGLSFATYGDLRHFLNQLVASFGDDRFYEESDSDGEDSEPNEIDDDHAPVFGFYKKGLPTLAEDEDDEKEDEDDDDSIRDESVVRMTKPVRPPPISDPRSPRNKRTSLPNSPRRAPRHPLRPPNSPLPPSNLVQSVQTQPIPSNSIFNSEYDPPYTQLAPQSPMIVRPNASTVSFAESGKPITPIPQAKLVRMLSRTSLKPRGSLVPNTPSGLHATTIFDTQQPRSEVPGI
ncbi:hypothetical protein BLNAU_6748 [Blattamonas nauphoetae]|uniref:CSC1/OSCA1-like cytosolic domain-containing protein n=1 Tax=Blattamonas nauphoetae TaxID=2049346 RepID=A0ABQ9Y3G5_9EUKA|nr:hypothetical protein BLNAU_6748 [Blattamonas nauphoetae]